MLRIENLVIEFATRSGPVRAIDGLNLELIPGEILGLVGESGAGKSLAGMALLGLLPHAASIRSGQIEFGGRRIDRLSEAEMRKIRGKHIAAIFQDPMTSLDPLMTIGEQLIETVMCHHAVTRDAAARKSIELLASVGIPAPQGRMHSYPHEFSGGMRQRVVIALALSGDPEIIVADEPTTALDVSVQAQILELLKALCKERGTSVILVTHDMGVIAQTADRVAVLYAGSIIEVGDVAQVINEPLHPYTIGLMRAVPEISGRAGDLDAIAGNMPRPGSWPGGCKFLPRCALSAPGCETIQELRRASGSHGVACHRAVGQLEIARAH